MTSICAVNLNCSNETEGKLEVFTDEVIEVPLNGDISDASRRLDNHQTRAAEPNNSQFLDDDVTIEEPTEQSVDPAPVDDTNCEPAIKLTSVGLAKEFIEELPKKVPLPSQDWFWLLNKVHKQASCSVNVTLKDQLLIKTAIITSPTTVTLLANGKPVSLTNLKTTFADYRDLYKTLLKFHTATLCQGITDESLKKIKLSKTVAAFKEKDGTIRANLCTFLSCPSNECKKCRRVRIYLKRIAQRPISKASKNCDNMNALKRKISYLSVKLEVNF